MFNLTYALVASAAANRRRHRCMVGEKARRGPHDGVVRALAEPQPTLGWARPDGDVLFARRLLGGRLDRVGRAGGETMAEAEENEHQ